MLALTNKRVLADDVTERIRHAILNGDFAPGEPLREERIAKVLDVSRGPVREALRRLEREGLVIVRCNHGASVARLSREDMEEVYSLRRALERVAASYAVSRSTDEDIAALDVVVHALKEAVDRGITEQEAAELDIRFHDIIYTAARHDRLYRCWSDLKPQIHVFLLSRNVANPDFRQRTFTEHWNILEALRARDEERAIRLLDKHICDTYLLVLEKEGQSTEETCSPLPQEKE